MRRFAALGLALVGALSAGAGVTSASPDNARGCPPNWYVLSTTPLDRLPTEPVPVPDGDVEGFVWSNITKTDGFATYMGLLDNNANGSLCVKWTWGDRLAEESSMRRTWGDVFDPLYFFVLRDDTSAAR